MHRATLRYWAGARAAAGVETETVEAATITDALAAARTRRDGDTRFDRVVSVCSLLVDGRATSTAACSEPLASDTTVELLPPFAGG